jgi:hypothetical protein
MAICSERISRAAARGGLHRHAWSIGYLSRIVGDHRPSSLGLETPGVEILYNYEEHADKRNSQER